MKKTFLFVVVVLLLTGCRIGRGRDEKPVIYLYPEREMKVSVTLEYDGELTASFPEYGNGWNVLAEPDGTLINIEDGKEYASLFWEGISHGEYDLSEGYVVKGEDTAGFLKDTLYIMGLNPRESGEFITYWYPRMRENPYNLITFQKNAYTDIAGLNIQPPDSILRIFMVYRPLEKPIPVKPPEIKPFKRTGFTVVEWGGRELQ